MEDNQTLIKNWGPIIGGKNSAQVDSIAATMAKIDINNICYFPLTIQTFGDFDHSVLSQIPKGYIKELK
ncbi:MAG: hypothetical protein ACOYT4_03045 [Nanoarchaeota archaeon]